MKKIVLVFSIMLLGFAAAAQQQAPPTEEEMEKKMYESIDKKVQFLTELLSLEYWQEFYVDSILNYNYHAMKDEMTELQSAKVGNAYMYVDVQDKWNDATFYAFQKVFNEAQWKKYLKTADARAKLARDKKAAKGKK